MITVLRIKQILKHSRLVRSLLDIVHKPKPMTYICNGDDYPDITFYVIGRDNPIAGGWSLINTVLMHLAFAKDKGYVPVIDMQNYRNQYTRDDEFGKVNFWEKYFYQPAGYSLEDIRNAKNVILCSSSLCPAPQYNTSDGSNIWEDEIKIKMFRQVFMQYVRYKENTQSFFDEKVGSVFGDKKNVIGVLCRGTDFLVNKPTGHEVQPDPQIVLSDVKKEFNKGKYDAIFLATEDLDILDMFLDEFGDKLMYLKQFRISKKEMKGDKWLSAELEGRDIDKDSEGFFLTYFSATYLLTKCSCLFAGRNNGSKGVLYMPSNFDFVKIYNLGQY